MNKGKSLEEALHEMDKWSDQVVQEIELLTPEQVIEYFKQSQSLLQELTGKRLDLPVRSTSHTPAA